MSIEDQKLKNILEAALMAVIKPMSTEQLLKLFDDDERPSISRVKQLLTELQQDYAERGVELKIVASGYRFQAKQEYSTWLSRLWEEKPAKYSRAFLETLSLIAYRQPVTRAEIEDVRGVGVSSSIVRTMVEREWIRIVGHRDVPGRPALYATTKGFLDYFNMKSLDELPSLAEIKELDDISPELELNDPTQVEDLTGDNSAESDFVEDDAIENDSIEDDLVENDSVDRDLTEKTESLNNDSSVDDTLVVEEVLTETSLTEENLIKDEMIDD